MDSESPRVRIFFPHDRVDHLGPIQVGVSQLPTVVVFGVTIIDCLCLQLFDARGFFG